MIIRRADEKDLREVADIYEEIHTAEENGDVTIGWIRGVYPTIDTAREAYECGELFVQEDDGRIVGAGRINQVQVDVYADGAWEYEAPDEEIMVFHTLVISPSVSGDIKPCVFNGIEGVQLVLLEKKL